MPYVNYFGRHGTVCKDPPFTVNLDGEPSVYGILDVRYTVREIAEWLTMADHGVPFGEVHRYCRDNNPTVILTDTRTGQIRKFSYNTGLLA